MVNKKILVAIVATITASLCCITPVLAVLAGSSSLASSFSWMEPYHNYLVALTIIVLIYAWWDKTRVNSNDIDCACDNESKVGFFSSKKFLAIVTIFSIAMLTFPQWGYKYFEVEFDCNSCEIEIKDKPPIVIKKTLSSCSTQDNCDTKVPVERIVEKEVNTDSLPVLQYMSDEKNNPTQYEQKTCSGTGFKEVDKLLANVRQVVDEVPPPVLKKMLDNDEDVILLDVREVAQRSEGEIYASDSYAMTRGNLEFNIINKIKDKNAVIVTYCRAGGISLFAAQSLKSIGYKNVYSLKGGLKAWAVAGYPFDNGLGVVVKVESEE